MYIEILFLFPLELCVTPPHFLVGSWSCMDQKVIHHRTSLEIGILSQCTSSGLSGMLFSQFCYINQMFPLSENITLSPVICPHYHVGIAWKSALHHLRALHIACYTMLKLCRHLKELWRGSLCVISVCDHTYLMIEITSSLFFFLISLVSVIPPFLGFRSRISLGVVPILFDFVPSFSWVLFPFSLRF